MQSLGQIVLSNAVWALVLAMGAAVASRVWRQRPALAHGLWLLVLIKLVTPSLVGFDVPASAPEPIIREAAPVIDEAPAIVASLPETASPPKAVVTPDPEPAPVPSDPPSIQAMAKPAVAIEPTHIEPPARAMAWPWVVASLWLAGVLAWFVAVTRHIGRFRRLLAEARPAPADIAERVAMLGESLKLRNTPSVWVVPARIPPMLWALLGRPRLLLPEELWQSLDDDQRDAVLIHELAHLKRRDHWVRRLEAVVLGLYWWNPVAWWARREVEKAEEECCDAWVVWARPDAVAAYAEALVTTAAYLSGPRPAWPLGATGAGRIPPLKKRLIMILRDQDSRSVLRPASRMTLILGIAALLTLPGWAPGEPPGAPKPAEAPQERAPEAPTRAPAPNEKEAAPTEKASSPPQEAPAPKLAGEGTNPGAVAEVYRPRLAKVAVFHPLVREISDYQDANGRFEVENKVEIRAEVSGRLERVLYKAGAMVKKGDILFQLEASEYNLEVDKAKAEHEKNLAPLERMKSALQRAKTLRVRDAITEEGLVTHQSNFTEAKAAWDISLANLKLAERKLELTRVRAPIDGRVGRQLVAAGSVVAGNITPLASIISLDSMWVEFELDSYRFKNLLDFESKLKAKRGPDSEITAMISLSSDFSAEAEMEKGHINLDDNELNSVNGTYRLRVAVPNPGHRRLPGMGATVRLVISDPHQETILPIATIDNYNQLLGQPPQGEPGTGQRHRILILNKKDEIEIRDITGHSYSGNPPQDMSDAFLIKEGLSPGDRVVSKYENMNYRGSAFQYRDVPGTGAASEVHLIPIPKMTTLWLHKPGQGDAKVAEPKR